MRTLSIAASAFAAFAVASNAHAGPATDDAQTLGQGLSIWGSASGKTAISSAGRGVLAVGSIGEVAEATKQSLGKTVEAATEGGFSLLSRTPLTAVANAIAGKTLAKAIGSFIQSEYDYYLLQRELAAEAKARIQSEEEEKMNAAAIYRKTIADAELMHKLLHGGPRIRLRIERYSAGQFSALALSAKVKSWTAAETQFIFGSGLQTEKLPKECTIELDDDDWQSKMLEIAIENSITGMTCQISSQRSRGPDRLDFSLRCTGTMPDSTWIRSKPISTTIIGEIRRQSDVIFVAVEHKQFGSKQLTKYEKC